MPAAAPLDEPAARAATACRRTRRSRRALPRAHGGDDERQGSGADVEPAAGSKRCSHRGSFSHKTSFVNRDYRNYASGEDSAQGGDSGRSPTTRSVMLRSPAPQCGSSSTSPARSSRRPGIPVTKHGVAKTPGGSARDRRRDRRPGGDQVAGADRRPDEGRWRAVRRHARRGRTSCRARARSRDRRSHARGVLVDSRAAVAHEYYAGVVWDGLRKRPVMLFSDMGGIDIEEVAEQPPRPRRPRPLLDAAAVPGLAGQAGRSLRSGSPARPEPAHADPRPARAAVHRSTT